MSTRPTFRDLKASYEQRGKATTATAYQSATGNLANMATSQRNSRVASIAKSIDSVLSSPPTSPLVRPLAALRPSWIGPARTERVVTPGIEAMKQHVTISYSSPGLQPPVYIFTDLSDPQWEAVEMRCEKIDEQYTFSKTFDVEEGEYQYKFRLGDGDWWTCDHSKPMVVDEQGNSNNSLVVKLEPLPAKTEAPKSASKDDHVTTVQSKTSPEVSATAPLFKHEILDTHKGSASEQTPEREEPNPFEGAIDEPEQPTVHAPLLHHESTKPSSVEQNHSPLFRHESISIGDGHPETSRKSSESSTRDSLPIPEEADASDASLYKFPVDHVGIINELRRASLRQEMEQSRSGEKANTSAVEIEEEIVIEIVENRKGSLETLVGFVGGPGNAMAIVLALLTVAAGALAMRFR